MRKFKVGDHICSPENVLYSHRLVGWVEEVQADGKYYCKTDFLCSDPYWVIFDHTADDRWILFNSVTKKETKEASDYYKAITG